MPEPIGFVRAAGLISVAAAASFAGAAQAGPVSTAPAGFTPLTIMGGATPESYDIDLDNDGQVDLQIIGGALKAPGFQLDALLTAPNFSAVTPLNGFSVQAFASPDDFVSLDGIGGGSNNGFLDGFTAATPYGEIGLIENASVGQIGYIKGIENPADGSFTLQDFGLVVVPEPASLTLLAAGVAGLAAFRRRRQAAAPA